MMKILLLSLFTLAFWHPIHISVSNVDYNPDTESLQISHKIFVDDLEKHLETQYKENMYIGTDQENPKLETFLQTYLEEHFSLEVNGKKMSVDYLNIKQDKDEMWVYSEIKGVKKIKTLALQNQILFGLYHDQSNIVHLNYLENKKTLRMTSSSSNQKVRF